MLAAPRDAHNYAKHRAGPYTQALGEEEKREMRGGGERGMGEAHHDDEPQHDDGKRCCESAQRQWRALGDGRRG
jgi:hypothetical protein